MADVMKRLGDVPLDRIRFHPPPGTATLEDVTRIQEKESRLCELIDGVLLEKAVGMRESFLAVFLGGLLNAFVRPRNLGVIMGPDGTLELMTGLVRIPDLAFFKWDRFPDRRLPEDPITLVAPNLAIEVLSVSNTLGEMAMKRIDYFQAGVELAWEIDPQKRTVTVYTSPTESTTLGSKDTLDGGAVLPGFQLPLADLFGELDRQG